MAAVGPAFMAVTERFAPSFAGRGAYPPIFRLSIAIGAVAGLGLVYERSCCTFTTTGAIRECCKEWDADEIGAVRFIGMNENAREVEMDMREMVAKVKKGEPLYGHSTLTPHMQGVAARNSRYSSLWTHIMPWANFTNHNQVCPQSPRRKWLDN
jgi:hypothetical protein